MITLLWNVFSYIQINAKNGLSFLGREWAIWISFTTNNSKKVFYCKQQQESLNCMVTNKLFIIINGSKLTDDIPLSFKYHQLAITCSKLTIGNIEIWNIYKVNNKDTRTTPNGVVLVSLLLTLNIFHISLLSFTTNFAPYLYFTTKNRSKT